MARPKKTRPRGACSKAAGDESRRTTIQCTLATPHTHPARSLPTPSPALNCSVCAPARSSRSPLARPLPYVHRTIGERNFTEPLALPAQLMDLASYCRDCTSAHALALSHHVFPFYSA